MKHFFFLEEAVNKGLSKLLEARNSFCKHVCLRVIGATIIVGRGAKRVTVFTARCIKTEGRDTDRWR